MNELSLVEAKEAEGVSAGHGLRTVGWARKGAVIAFLAVASQPFG